MTERNRVRHWTCPGCDSKRTSVHEQHGDYVTRYRCENCLVTFPAWIPSPELPELPFEAADFAEPPARCHHSGNRFLDGCPILFCWKFKLVRHTSADERAWLKARGWRFSGGRWFRPDDGPTYYGSADPRRILR